MSTQVHPPLAHKSFADSDQPRANSEVRLSVEQVSYAYAANPSQAPLFTLEALSFQAKPGEIVAILGPNACGKSTLLKLISGALEPLPAAFSLTVFRLIRFLLKPEPSASRSCNRKALSSFPRVLGNLCCKVESLWSLASF